MVMCTVSDNHPICLLKAVIHQISWKTMKGAKGATADVGLRGGRGMQ